MRKFQKEQAENFIQLLGEAHEEIRANIEKKNYEPVLVTLADCQDGAIALGNLLEVAEGENCTTIPLLEKYCELVFRIHTDISEGGYVDALKTDRSLRKALTQIENSVRNDIKVRKEIAFFPYNASMWDSLESVYLAAKEDQDCDAYCVPIPYFEKRADGKLGQAHYEGAEYPKNIEITDWQTYNFEERRPDVMYIHNPYDASNRVTCVHPRFFSSNLKKYTDELVYIPYFVGPEIDPKDQAAIERMKHFCFLPGVIHADKVILQSENHRQVYIAEYSKAAKQFGLEAKHTDPEYLEEKFLALGSPKFDKVLRTKKEDIDIPDEWIRVIKKPDGSFKKIVFYNTSIQALLIHKEQMLKKMKHVLETFKENKDEVALLWRPHPLLESTIKSMLPQLWEEYDALTRKYREEGWGIWDDTKDMNRAVALSDAYYGDSSSVLQVYQKTGKPIMVQNVNCFTFDWSNLISGKGICINDKEMWMPMMMLNVIVHVDLTTMQVEKCSGFGEKCSDDKLRKSYMYTALTEWNGKLIFAPTRANRIALYDKQTCELENIDLDIPDEFWSGIPNYTFILQTKDELFFIGISQTNSIMKWNLETGDTEFYGWIINRDINMQKKAVYGMNGVVINNVLYVPLLYDGMIYQLELETGNEKIEKIDEKGRELATINFWNKQFYITTNTGQLIKWNGKNPEELELPNSKGIYTSFCKNDFLWLFPRVAQETIVKINLKTDEIHEIFFDHEVYDVEFDKKEACLVLNTRGGIAKLNIYDNAIERQEFVVEGIDNIRDVVEKWDKCMDVQAEVLEGNPEYVTLDEFLNSIMEA